jgi:hypothetical protein
VRVLWLNGEFSSEYDNESTPNNMPEVVVDSPTLTEDCVVVLDATSRDDGSSAPDGEERLYMSEEDSD